MARRKFQEQDIVRYTAKFLRSTGMFTGEPKNGLVVGFMKLGGKQIPLVLWSDADEPVGVQPENLELDKRAMARRQRAPNRTVQGYEIPATGNLPKHGVEQFEAVYVSSRSRGFDQQRSAQQAWCAVKRYYYKRGGKWRKRKDPLGPDEQPPGCVPLRSNNPASDLRRRKNRLLR